MSQRAQKQGRQQISRMPAGGVLQRQCACGTHTSGGDCSACSKKKDANALQRAAINAEPSNGVPPIVGEVLGSPGQALDTSTRAYFEPRFGHDFSRVRVHTDARAAASARAVNARAYTVGEDVAFAAGQYAPHSPAGRKLLAHELTHVVQQAASSPALRGAGVVAGHSNVFEREAESVADSIMKGDAAQSLLRESATLRKDGDKKSDLIDVDLVPVSPAENERLKKMGIELPTVSDETWRSIGGVADNAGKKLSEPEKKKIEKLLKDAKMPAATPLASVQGARFLLHDTSSPVGATEIANQAKIGRGPMGKGVSAWVPRDDPSTIARPNFYEGKRPSTTEYERGVDILEDDDVKKGKKVVKLPERETRIRAVGQVTDAAVLGKALDSVLTGQSLTADETKAIKAGAQTFLKGSDTKVDGARTAASWAVGDVCAASQAKGAKTVAQSGKDKDLEAGCKQLEKYYVERPARISSLVTVEIVQVGVKSEKGNQNTCDPKNSNVKPLPNPPYTDNQYTNIALLYLRAAATAGSFPETTTHFVIDAFEQGHCDPRCFNLMKLYDTIAGLMGHGKGSTYGVKPQYGLKWGKDTIWWDDTICGQSHP